MKGAAAEEGTEVQASPGVSAEENPLEGVVADDGDPGPPPELDPSIVTKPSSKVRVWIRSIVKVSSAARWSVLLVVRCCGCVSYCIVNNSTVSW